MSAKKVSIARRPNAESHGVDSWVSDREDLIKSKEPKVVTKMKRLTIDIPESLHRAIKRKAVEEGVAMADLLRSLLEERYL